MHGVTVSTIRTANSVWFEFLGAKILDYYDVCQKYNVADVIYLYISHTEQQSAFFFLYCNEDYSWC